MNEGEFIKCEKWLETWFPFKIVATFYSYFFSTFCRHFLYGWRFTAREKKWKNRHKWINRVREVLGAVTSMLGLISGIAIRANDKTKHTQKGETFECHTNEHDPRRNRKGRCAPARRKEQRNKQPLFKCWLFWRHFRAYRANRMRRRRSDLDRLALHRLYESHRLEINTFEFYRKFPRPSPEYHLFGGLLALVPPTIVIVIIVARLHLFFYLFCMNYFCHFNLQYIIFESVYHFVHISRVAVVAMALSQCVCSFCIIACKSIYFLFFFSQYFQLHKIQNVHKC